MFESKLEVNEHSVTIPWRAKDFDSRLTPAIWIPVARCVVPLIFVLWMPSNIFPKSSVKVTSTSGPLPPMLIRPTDDSGFDCVFALNMILTASDCASHLEGLREIY
jgi:hypothetical protein